MKAQFVFENIRFERGQDPKTAMGIGVIAKIEDMINDEEQLDDIMNEMDQQLGAAMNVFLPEEEKKEIARMWLRNHYELPPYTEFKVLYREDGDEDEEASGPKIDYEVKELESQGWKVFYEENNFGQVETILIREKLK